MSIIENNILNLLLAGKKAEAVRLYQTHAAVDFGAAKDYVDNLCDGQVENTLNDDLNTKLITLCKQNNKILAIKLFAETKKVDLKTAFEYINSLQQKQGIPNINSKPTSLWGSFFYVMFKHSIFYRPLSSIWNFFKNRKTKNW